MRVVLRHGKSDDSNFSQLPVDSVMRGVIILHEAWQRTDNSAPSRAMLPRNSKQQGQHHPKSGSIDEIYIGKQNLSLKFEQREHK